MMKAYCRVCNVRGDRVIMFMAHFTVSCAADVGLRCTKVVLGIRNGHDKVKRDRKNG